MSEPAESQLEDLKIKYQKLALEYSKVRAQNKVLKSGILEEQQKGVQIKENFKLKDQSLRKAEQELDSLTFRNQQLTKRLSLLQDDLENLQAKGSNVDAGSAYNNSLHHTVFAEELQGKIQENARLHAQLADSDESHLRELSELEDKSFLVKQQLTKQIDELRQNEVILKEKVSQLKNGQVLLEVTAQQKSMEMRSIQEKLQNLQTGASITDQAASYEGNQNLQLNLNNQKKLHMKDLVQNLSPPIEKLSTGFIMVLTTYSSLLLSYGSYDAQIKILEYELPVWENLGKNYSSFIRDTGGAISNSLKVENIKKISIITKSVISCASSLKKLLPVLSKRFDATGEKNDARWKSSLGRFVSCWASMIPHLTTVTSIDVKDEEDIQLSVVRSVSLLGERMVKLQAISQELVSSWDGSENDMQTYLQSICSSFEQIISVNKQMLLCLNENTETPSTPSSAEIPPMNSNNVEISATSPTQSLAAWSENSSEGAVGGSSEASLAQQLEQATSRLSKLEEEKDHWRLEYQLLSHKQQNENQIKADTSHTPYQANQSTNNQESVSQTSIIAEVTSNSDHNREQKIRNHFTERCRYLYMQHTSTTSQAALYQNECDAIMKKLAITEELREAAYEESQNMKKQANILQESLQTTSRNYEEQISTMSEHVADLNEKIATQQDTIEQLIYQQKSKKSKK